MSEDVHELHRYKEGGRMVTVSKCRTTKFIEVTNDMFRIIDTETGKTLGRLKLNKKGEGKNDK